MKKIGLSTFELQKKFGDHEALRIAKSVGADAVDFNLTVFDKYDVSSVYAKSEQEIAEYFTSLKNLADELGLVINQTHGRIKGYVGEPEADARLVENARFDCMVTRILGADVCVIHTASNYYYGIDASREVMMDANRDMFVKMLEHAAEFNVRLATETFGDVGGSSNICFFGNFDNFCASIKDVREHSAHGDLLCACMDTGHSHRTVKHGCPSVADQIIGLGKEIAVLHIHDNHGYGDEHLIPADGTLDWKSVIEALDRIGFDGVYNLEISLSRYGEYMCDTARRAVSVMRELIGKYGA